MVKPSHRSTVRELYIHHIAWGGVCLLLFFAVLMLWFLNQELGRKTVNLEHTLAAISRETCSVRTPWQAGTTKQFSVPTPHGNREYGVHLPANFNKTQYYPTLFYYGGKGGTWQQGEAISGINQLPVIAIYPSPTHGTDGALSWQSAPYSSGADDIAFTKAILTDIQSTLCVDRTRIYAMGMSNGGGIVSLLSCKMSDTFAAVGIGAAALYYPDARCTPSQPVPLINIHGDADGIVPYYGSATRKLPPIDSWMQWRAEQNHCLPLPQTSPAPALTITTTVWQSCAHNATVQNVKIQGGGHIWNNAIRDTAWQFMSQFSLQ